MVEARRVLITGGSSGIGLAAAMRFAGQGARIVVNGRNHARGEAARQRVAEAGAEAHFVPADVSTQAGASALVIQAEALLGGFDVLVNAAGGDAIPALFHETNLDQIDAIVRSWLLATIYMCRLALPHVQDGGVVINVASDAAKVPTPGESVIGGAMAGIAMFSRTVALEAKRRRIRVHAVTPSLVSGTLTTARITQNGFSARLFEKAAAAAALGVASPDDVAATIEFLASASAERMTGQVISVNGGISAG